MMDNQGAEKFENNPGMGAEVLSDDLQKAKDWEMAMAGEKGGEVPEFKGDKYGIAKEENNYYGEAVDDESENKYDSDLAEASNILNFGLDSIARTFGIETTIKKIKEFDVSGRADPIGDLFLEFGIDTKVEADDLDDEDEANATKVNVARREVNAVSQSKSVEAARRAIQEMKELISEIEGADPKYETLREGAKQAGMGYFEYAIKDYNTRGLTELFQVLASQKVENGNSSVINKNDVEVLGDEQKEDEDGSKEQLNPEILKQQ